MRCRVYRCSRHDGMYIYVADDRALEQLPVDLLKRAGKLEMVMDLELSEERKLARADVERVKKDLLTQGFYLQMPPQLDPRLCAGD